ncbi:MAG TPA: hypothetical protein VFO25_13705 [Candidatus Eremiobacteraceae bacterium]|nr:hypothetical protein [Candidatus Eremiobacteraceae bacterium]
MMSVRLVTLTAVAVICLFSSQSIAHAAPVSTADQNVVLNHRLALMALAPAPSRIARASELEDLFSRTAADEHRKPDWWSSVTFKAIASRFISAERFLHFRQGGVDANFWGVMNRGGSLRIKYSVRLR